MALNISFFGLFLSGCATVGSKHYTSPHWWDDPQRHGPQHLYFKAKGESSRALEQARQNALQSIQGQIAEYVFAEVKVDKTTDTSRVIIQSAVELREIEIFQEDDARGARGWVVWMLGRYPRSEYNRIRKRLEMGTRLELLWRGAQSAANRQQMAEGETLLLEIVQNYDKALRASFDLESVKLELASLYLKQNRGLKARQWIADVQKSATDAKWRRRADELFRQLPPFSLRDAFDDRTVGVYSCIRKDGKIAAAPELTQDLNIRLSKDGIRTVYRQDILLTDDDFFDESGIKRVASHFAGLGADAVLLVLLDIDTSKTGTEVNISGSTAKMKAYDARLHYWVIRSTDGLILASDNTIGFSHAPSALLNTILTHRRHLPNYAPSIAEQLGANGEH